MKKRRNSGRHDLPSKIETFIFFSKILLKFLKFQFYLTIIKIKVKLKKRKFRRVLIKTLGEKGIPRRTARNIGGKVADKISFEEILSIRRFLGMLRRELH